MATIPPIQPSPPLPPGGKPGGIGERAENALLRFTYRVFDGLKNQLSDLARHVLDNLMEGLEQAALPYIAPVLDEMIGSDSVPESVNQMLRKARNPSGQFEIAAVGGALLGLLWGIISGGSRPFARGIEQTVDKRVRSQLLDPATTIAAMFRREITEDHAKEILARQGLNEVSIKALFEVLRPRVAVGDLLTGIWREEKTRQDVFDEFRDRGFLPHDADFLLKMNQNIPGPGDLVRMGVREAFNDAVSTAYGYDSAFPAEFGEWMRKQGYDPMWARYYWRAHWELPSVQMGFEMLHRRIINRDELRDLLRTLDIAPGWIERLIQMSYNTYTRVDTRRMYAAGVLGMDEVIQSYLDQGYPSDKAQKMAAWTVQDAVNEAAGLTRSSVQKSYGKGRISRVEALDMLEQLGTARDVADFILEQADLDRADDLLDRQIATVGKRFKNGQLSESEAYNQLGTLGVQGKEVQVLIDEWRASMSATVRRPSRSDLDRFFEQGVLDLNRYRDELSLEGYSAEYVGWYVASLSFEAQQERYDQAEKARKEAERVAALRKKTVLQTARADLDLQIAELRATIADAQVALVSVVNERDARLRSVLPDAEIAAIKLEHAPLLNEADAAIAQAQLKISQVNATVGQARTRIAEISVALSENRDYAMENELRASRLGLQTDQASLNAESKQRETEIARLKEQSIDLETEEQIFDTQQRILTLQREIAERNEQVAAIAVQIDQIDEQLPATLNTVRRAELQTEQANLNVTIRENESLVDALQTTIRQAQADRLAVEQDMQADIARLPSRGDQIEIQAHYATQIDEIEARIVGLRAEIRDLQVEKSRLNVGG